MKIQCLRSKALARSIRSVAIPEHSQMNDMLFTVIVVAAVVALVLFVTIIVTTPNPFPIVM